MSCLIPFIATHCLLPAADDEENWAMHLTPQLFWAHHEDFLEFQNESDLLALVSELVQTLPAAPPPPPIRISTVGGVPLDCSIVVAGWSPDSVSFTTPIRRVVCCSLVASASVFPPSAGQSRFEMPLPSAHSTFVFRNHRYFLYNVSHFIAFPRTDICSTFSPQPQSN